MNAFMEEFLPSHLELLTRTPVIYVHLLAHNGGGGGGGEVGLALQVAVHNTPRVTSTRIPQPYM